MLSHGGVRYRLIDTAGLRKTAKVTDQIEYYTVLRTLRAIRSSQVVAILLDATTELSHQDMSIAADVVEAGRAMVFVVNKWDAIEKDTDTAGAYVNELKKRAKPFAFAPVVFISALTGQRATKVLEFAAGAATERLKHVPTAELTESILGDVRAHPPPAVKGRFIRIKYVTQSEHPPPSFVFFCNHPELVRAPYKRYLTNRLRDRYGFVGSPIVIRFRRK